MCNCLKRETVRSESVISKQQPLLSRRINDLELLFSNDGIGRESFHRGTVSRFLSCKENRNRDWTSRSLIEEVRFDALHADVKQKFDFAHCRTFETLHRPYYLSYTGAQDRLDIRYAVVVAIRESDPRRRLDCYREGTDCDRVNGTVDTTRPLLHTA